MSTSSQHQFRYTQTPSKVLHLRNLPWECSEEELIELGKPFGKIVNTKCNVGANHNQAFVEFVISLSLSFLLPYLTVFLFLSSIRDIFAYLGFLFVHFLIRVKLSSMYHTFFYGLNLHQSHYAFRILESCLLLKSTIELRASKLGLSLATGFDYISISSYSLALLLKKNGSVNLCLSFCIFKLSIQLIYPGSRHISVMIKF